MRAKAALSRADLHMPAQPGHQRLKTEAVGRIQIRDERVRFCRRRLKPQVVDRQERIGRGKGGPLVGVDEGVVLGQAFPKSGGLLDDIGNGGVARRTLYLTTQNR
jgi:hypothetical protein